MWFCAYKASTISASPPASHITWLAISAITLLSCSVGAAARWPMPDWPESTPQQLGIDPAALKSAKDYSLSAGGSGMIVVDGQVLLRWGDQHQLYDIKSATKSFGSTMLGVAIRDGKIDLDAPALQYHSTFGQPPASNGETNWLERITIRHLASQTAGFEKPGGYQQLLFAPGTKWHYSDGGPNWLAECITLAYGQDLQELMFERVFSPLGIQKEELRWRRNQYRDRLIDGIPRREFGAGIHANVNALARLGYLYLRNGRWQDATILDADFVRLATTTAYPDIPAHDVKAHGNAAQHYGLLWWNNSDGALADVPRDAFWAWGLYDSLIVVVPSLELVVARGGARGRKLPRGKDKDHYLVLAPLLQPIVSAVAKRRPSGASTAPYPRSEYIKNISWAPREQIVRLAEGSDNWPITWADDGRLYGAYGDGWGFRPRVEKKLSLGLVRVEGSPPDIRGFNIRSSVEQTGQGPQGKKCSGLLMVDGTLYMLVRNSGNAQLAWSADHGRNWKWADWKWTTSFGCPTFLNFGSNYAGARDEYVYVYSQDSHSAYLSADRMVMARVPRSQVTDRQAYEFFSRIDVQGRPLWTKEIERRGAVFVNPNACYRSGISYNAGLGRYLWCQTLPESPDKRGPRFAGGFGVYESPNPWGPWKTVYFTRRWDVGPGETSCFPTKWMSEDGRSLYLVFSGEDCFSVRQATLHLTD